MAGELASIYVHIPSTAADTEDEWYVPVAFPGSWRIIKAKFAPATAVTAHDTNYITLTLSTNASAASTSWTTIGSTDTTIANTGLVIGTTRSFTLSGAGLAVSEGQQIRIEKDDPGSGQILDGTWAFVLEKVN